MSIAPTRVLVLRVVYILAIAAASGVVGASAATFSVSPGSATIHAALAAASPGDTLLLQPGTYSTDSPVDIHKNVTIISALGPAVTIVDLQYNFGSVFYVYPIGQGPTIEGLTIRRGAQNITGAGAGIYAAGASPTIVNNLLESNGAGNIDGYGGAGAAIAVFDGNPIIRQNTIVNNFASFGAVYLSQCGGEMERNIIALNYDAHEGQNVGYGLTCDNATTLVHDNMFWNNGSEDVYSSCNLQLGGPGNNLVLDPHFCNPVSGPKATSADWGVSSDAPSAPGHPYSGWGAGLPGCGVTSILPRSWGYIKGQYR